MIDPTCGCCEGLEQLTPIAIANRPGLNALTYRVGTHSTFLETMKALLSNSGYPGLVGLKTRDRDDPAIAFLDAWATVADVLTFYQERIANEGYLRAAMERRSVVELAQLVGYTPRPGVSSSAYLTFTLENTATDDTVIPAGTRAQSLPGPGELPQSFETSEDLKARIKWNQIRPRLTQPQIITCDTTTNTINVDKIYLKSTATNLKPNDPLLFVCGSAQILRHVKTVELQETENRTKITLQEAPTPPQRESTDSNESVNGLLVASASKQVAFEKLASVLEPLSRPPTVQPANSLRLSRNVQQIFNSKSDALPKLLTQLQPALKPVLYKAWNSISVTPTSLVEVYALRVKASPFGHNSLKESQYEPPFLPEGEEFRPNPNAGNLRPQSTWLEWGLGGDERGNVIFLDTSYDSIIPGSYIAIQSPEDPNLTSFTIQILKVDQVVTRSRNAYGLTAKTTVITLGDGESWWNPPPSETTADDFSFIRGTTVYAHSEKLEVADAPLETSIGYDKDQRSLAKQIELDGLYDGLEPGRWIVVSGNRADVDNVEGFKSSELVMLAGITQDFDPNLPGDKTHTFLTLANEGLAYSYKRDTVVIYANVVKATHGETRPEVLGSGDGSKAFQQFALRQQPLTYLPAPTPAGSVSTLQVRVNDILWHEVNSLAALSPTDRNFVTRTNDEGKTSVVFGNGDSGARLPTGVENITAAYRTGIGKVGNIKAEQISLLATRPLGVKSVINPLLATGGADRESRDQARRNIPLAVMSLDRLVSVQDYADFARTFAGIGKASARALSDGRRQLVHLTIAGADDIPISYQSDLYRNLLEALRQFGDPNQSIRVEVRELILLIISANIQILPDYRWESVATQVRSMLLDTFSFDRRELGQEVFLSEIISTIQQIPGVVYVDVDIFGGLPEQSESAREASLPTQIIQKVKEIIGQAGAANLNDPRSQNTPPSRIQVNLARSDRDGIRPAQIAYLSPAIPETLNLVERKP